MFICFRVILCISSVIQNYWKWTRYMAIQTLAKIAEFIALNCLALYYMVEAVVWSMTPSFLIPEKSIRGKVVLVTGGAGGLGRELVLRLARQDARVVVWDNNEKAMAELTEKTKSEGHLIHTYPVDVTDREVVYKYAKMVKEDVGPIDILINNAGIVCGQTFLDIPDYMIEKTFKVNILAHYWTVKAFLPDMMKRKEGHIVTVGSLTGLIGTYKCTDYSASKFATVGFHESLSTELKTHGHHNINMTLICPYFINTGMFDGCKPKNFPMLEPKDVAKRIITAIKRDEVFITLPASSRFVIPLKNYLPSKLGWALMIRVIKGPQSMMGMRSFKEIEAA
nr:epidermal retinol dehydrogenase 2-like isoform X1 [Leptinotarsa decemlineata]